MNPFGARSPIVGIVPVGTRLSEAPPDGTLRIQLVSMLEFKKDDRSELPFVTFRRRARNLDLPSLERGLCVQAPRRAKTYEQDFLKAMRMVLSADPDSNRPKPDIVCVNELAFPASAKGPSLAVGSELGQLAEAGGQFVVAGTAHDTRSLYNTAYAFYPGCPPYGWKYHKQVSATHPEVKERVSVPGVRRTAAFAAFGIRLSILTCLDICDYSSVLPVVQNRDGIDLLLVPSYSERIDRLVTMAKVVSKGMGGLVALVNHAVPGNRGRLFRFGEGVTESGSGIISANGQVLGDVTWFNLDLAKFRQGRDDLSHDPSDELEWLFPS